MASRRLSGNSGKSSGKSGGSGSTKSGKSYPNTLSGRRSKTHGTKEQII
jgi:hypothetical protein